MSKIGIKYFFEMAFHLDEILGKIRTTNGTTYYFLCVRVTIHNIVFQRLLLLQFSKKRQGL